MKGEGEILMNSEVVTDNTSNDLDIESLPITIFLKNLADDCGVSESVIKETPLIDIVIGEFFKLVAATTADNNKRIEAIDSMEFDRKTDKQVKYRNSLNEQNRNLAAMLSMFESVIRSYDYASKKHSITMFEYFNKINIYIKEIDNLNNEVERLNGQIEHEKFYNKFMYAEIEKLRADIHLLNQRILNNKY